MATALMTREDMDRIGQACFEITIEQ